jgi:hypothetical protein
MKKLLPVLLVMSCVWSAEAQTAQDLFRSDIQVTWLGIDYSHVRLIGNFAEFFEAGEKSTWQIRDIYFPRWNAIIMEEPAKYDIRGMLRKSDIQYNIDMITTINANTPLEEMESYNPVKFSEDDIQFFVQQYNLTGMEGIGLVFITESLNKNSLEAWYHVVAIDMNTHQILLHERLRGEPKGFGFRNYWANSVHHVIRSIRDYYYWEWKKRVKSEGGQV